MGYVPPCVKRRHLTWSRPRSGCRSSSGQTSGGPAAHTPLALRAAGAILSYLHVTHKAPLAHLTRLQHYRLSHYMVLDAVTRRNLELVRTMRQGERQGSVLAVLDETVTAMGARLLRRWLEQPLLQLDTIAARQDAVAELLADPARRQHLRQALKGIADIERLLGRIACGTANARQLVVLVRRCNVCHSCVRRSTVWQHRCSGRCGLPVSVKRPSSPCCSGPSLRILPRPYAMVA